MVGHDGADRVALAVVGLLAEQDEVGALALERLGQRVAGGGDVGAGERVVGQVHRAVGAERDGLVERAHGASPGPSSRRRSRRPGRAPPSLICIAASMACVSYGLRFFSPLRSMRPVDGSMRFSTAASGTSLTRTQIFTAGLLVGKRSGSHATRVD